VNVLATGPFGYPNFGNESYVDTLQSRLAGCKLDIQSRVDEVDLRLNRYDLTILAGGGVLYHSVSDVGDSSLKYYLRYPAVAQWLGRKSMMMGVGTQGSIQSEDLVPYVNVLEGLDLCTVRDSSSARILRESGIRSAILECADLFYTKTIYPNLARARRMEGGRVDGKPVLGVVASQPGKGLLHPEFPGFEDRFQEALRVLEKTFRLHFFSFDNRSDPWLSTAVTSWSSGHAYTSFDVTRPDSIDAFIHAFGAVDAFVTTRYHGVLLSIMTETPFLAIGAPGEKLHRECEAIQYPSFISYASSSKQFVESAQEIWAERETLHPILHAGARNRRRLAMRNFELMESKLAWPDRNGSRMIPQIAASIRQSSSSRTLLIWAAGMDCWREAAGLFNQLPNFDCMLPPNSSLQHRSIEQRFVLPDPGVFNWSAFPQELKGRIEMKFDNVIVCHEGTASKARDLLEIASAAGRRIWEFDVWKHSLRSISDADAATHRRRQSQIEQVTA
jgi:Polysaccharide pyruvyl transferase